MSKIPLPLFFYRRRVQLILQDGLELILRGQLEHGGQTEMMLRGQLELVELILHVHWSTEDEYN